jgi:hypothetical protein
MTDLLEYTTLAWLTGRLCEEAGVCLTGDTEGNRVEIHAATYDVIKGLRVSDGKGHTYRLRVTAEEA